MKTKKNLWMAGILAAAGLAAGCVVFSAGDWRVPNGEGGSWRVVFEDEGVGRGERAAMAEDYLGILAELAPQGSYDFQGRQRDGKGREIKWMEWSVEKPRCPDRGEDEIGRLVVEEDGEEVAMVSKKLSDAYREAFRLWEKHPGAYRQLEAFLQRLNHLKEENPPESFDGLFYFPETHREYLLGFFEDLGMEKIVGTYSMMDYRFRSVLDCAENDGKLIALLIMSMADDGSGKSFVEEYPVVFDGGQWKLLASDWGASC
jgi:hypothetical protein